MNQKSPNVKRLAMRLRSIPAVAGAAGLMVIFCLAGYLLFSGSAALPERGSEYWEDSIRGLEIAAREAPLPTDSVLFLGSSSIRLWTSLAQDMAPVPVIQRGFGGAQLNDVSYFAERLLAVPKPIAIVIFAGANDIIRKTATEPTQLLHRYQQLVARLWQVVPGTPIYYIAITPAPHRLQFWPLSRAANRLIERYSSSSELLHFIDTNQVLLGSNGIPQRQFYHEDEIHLSAQGYSVWREIIRARLLADFPRYQMQP
jgi:lysophospholipase L1-like esterase